MSSDLPVAPALERPMLLRKLRRGSGLTLREASRRAGINHGYLSQLERGHIRAPSPHMLRKLAEVYDQPPMLLLCWAGYLADDPSALTANQQRLLHAVGEPTAAEVDVITAVLVAIRQTRTADDVNVKKGMSA